MSLDWLLIFLQIHLVLAPFSTLNILCFGVFVRSLLFFFFFFFLTPLVVACFIFAAAGNVAHRSLRHPGEDTSLCCKHLVVPCFLTAILPTLCFCLIQSACWPIRLTIRPLLCSGGFSFPEVVFMKSHAPADTVRSISRISHIHKNQKHQTQSGIPWIFARIGVKLKHCRLWDLRAQEIQYSPRERPKLETTMSVVG